MFDIKIGEALMSKAEAGDLLHDLEPRGLARLSQGKHDRLFGELPKKLPRVCAQLGRTGAEYGCIEVLKRLHAHEKLVCFDHDMLKLLRSVLSAVSAGALIIGTLKFDRIMMPRFTKDAVAALKKQPPISELLSSGSLASSLAEGARQNIRAELEFGATA